MYIHIYIYIYIYIYIQIHIARCIFSPSEKLIKLVCPAQMVSVRVLLAMKADGGNTTPSTISLIVLLQTHTDPPRSPPLTKKKE